MMQLRMRMNPMQSPVLLSVVILTVSIRLVIGQAQVPAPAATAMRFPSLPPTASQSGIAYFRELLSAKPEEREKLLAGKSLGIRKVLEKGIRDYEALSPEERELRLQTMELRYNIMSMLPVKNRTERLKLVPGHLRKLVEDRLKYWDGLSPADQKEAVENERAARILGIAGPGSKMKEIPLNGQASNQVMQIEQQLVRWQSLPEVRREQIQKNFTTLFEFSDEEKARTQLQALPLSVDERELMEKTIADFKKLPVAARELCVRNFPKFAELTPQERRQFLYNVQEWQKMTSEDRQTWRKLVSKVPRMPPLPPGLGQPPLPKRALGLPAPAAQATNR